MENTKEAKTNKKIIIKLFLSIILVAIITTCGFIFKEDIENKFNSVNDYDKNKNYEGLTVHYLNVGQGDSTFIVFPDGKTLLIDTGPVSGAKYMLDFLITSHYKDKNLTLDYLILTHSDQDHVGGTANLLKTFQVNNIIRPKIYDCYDDNEIDINRDSNLPTKYCKSDSIIYHNVIESIYSEPNCEVVFSDIDYLNNNFSICEENSSSNNYYDFKFYSPTKTYYGANNTNDLSLVFTINYKSKIFMFMGDASIEVEEELLDKYNLPKVDYLKVGHHGSKHSSCNEFINKILPDYSIISVGKNRFGHPSNEVINILSDNYSKILRTDESGTIVINIALNGNEIVLFSNTDKFYVKAEYIIIGFDAICLYLVYFVEINRIKSKSKRKRK